MREQRDEQEPRELFNAEVSIYTDIVVQLSRQKSKLFIMN